MLVENHSNLYDLFPWIVYDDDPISVLIVEDDSVMQAQFASLVRSLDYEVTIQKVTKAEDAKLLLEGKNFERFDLIIADQYLDGDETGIDLWNHCRQNYPDVRFILTSGEQLKSFMERLAPLMEKPDFLEKPFSTTQAIKQIERSLNEADHTKIIANIRERDSVKVPIPDEKSLPAGKKRRWDTNLLLAFLFSLYLAVVATQAGRIWGEDYQPISKWLSSEEEKTVQDEKNFEFYGDSLWNPKPLEQVDVPKTFRTPKPRE